MAHHTPKGVRYGGIGKGGKWKATLEKEAVRELVRQKITERLAPMIDAQIEHAIGIKHGFLRRADGTFERSDDPDKMLAAFNSGDATSFYIFTKDPSVQAFSDLMNRAIDKPKEQVQEVLNKIDGLDELVKKLDAFKARNQQRRS